MPIGSGGIVEIFLPAGGTAGQAVVKIDSVDYNFSFGAGGGGGIGTVSAGTTNATGPGISFSNGSGVTFGLNGNTITASVAAAAGAQTGISSLIAGQTQTIGALSFSNASGVTFGIASGALTGTLTASVRTDYQSSNANYLTSQSNQAFSAQGGSSAFQTLVFTNSNGVSFSNTNGSVWASVAAQSVQTQASGAIAGSGFTSAGAQIGLSGTLNSLGLSLSATVPSQSNQTAGVYASSQTFGQSSSSTYDARSLSLVGSGAVSVGWSNSSLLISGATQTVQTQASGAIAGSGVTTAGNNIGLSGTLNSAGLSISATVAAPVAQTNQTLGVYASSQTFGQSSSSTHDARSLSIVGSGGVSVGWSNSSLLISGTTYPAQSNQSAIKGLGASNTGNTAGNTGLSSGIDWVLAGSNNITISQSTVGGGPNTLWVSGPSVGGAQTGISGIVVSNTTYTSGTVSFSNANGISFGSSAGQAITASYTVPVQTVDTAAIYITAQSTGQSSSSTYDLRTLSLVGDGIVSIGWSNSSLRVSATQSNQAFSAVGGSSAFQTLGFSDNSAASWTNTNGSVALASVRASLYATSNTTQSSTGTANLNSLIFAGAGIASVGVTGGSVVISVPTGGGAGDGGVFAGVSTAGNTAGSTGTVSTGNFVLAGMGGISLSQSTGAAGSAATVSISAPASSLLSGSNGISLSTNGSTIYISAQQFTGSWWQPEIFGNTVTTTFANNTVYVRPFEPANYLDINKAIFMVSNSSSASTASFSASVSAGNASSGTASWGHSGTVLLFSRVNTNQTHADYTKIITQDSHTYSFGAGYTAAVSWSTNASSATASVSTTGGVSWIASVNNTGGITTSATTSSTTTSFSSTSTNQNSFSSSFILTFPYAHLSGVRPVFAPMSGSTLSPGEYWLGLQVSTASASTNMSLQRVAMMASVHYVVFTALTNNYMEIGNSVAITSSNYRLGFGSHSGVNQTTTTMALSAVSTNASNMSMWFMLDGKTMP